MELKDKLQNLSKHSEHRRTSPPFLSGGVFMPWSVGTSGFDPCTRFCDVSIQAAQLRSVLGVHTGFTSQMVPNADIRRSARTTNKK